MSNDRITLNTKEAAKYLGLSPSTLAKLRLSGNGPDYCKLGRRVIYLKEYLDAWLQSLRTRNTSDADARLPKSLTGGQAEKKDGGSNTPCGRQRSRRTRASARPVHTDSAVSETKLG
jgi:predicted DNA-binding transcriptional regulator AlpA